MKDFWPQTCFWLPSMQIYVFYKKTYIFICYFLLLIYFIIDYYLHLLFVYLFCMHIFVYVYAYMPCTCIDFHMLIYINIRV